MNALSNRPTLDELRHMPVAEILALPAEHLALLQTDSVDALDAARQLHDWLNAAIALRYEQRAIAARGVAGKDTGIVRFQDGNVEITADLPTKVEWNQRRLAALAEPIRAGGEDPGQYVEVSFKVSERAYTAWPDRIREAFEPARTVRTGRATYRLAIMSETALRDSPHGAGVIPLRGGR